MKRMGVWLRAFGVSVCLGAAWGAMAAGASDSCEREASAAPASEGRNFLVLAASKGVFHDQSGPSFVILMRTHTATDELEMGAVGIYADEKKRAVFGAVPWRAYDPFLREPGKNAQAIMLRLEISEPQYGRVLGILRDWQRRAREGELLYSNDIYMNNILLVKQVTETLNQCKPTLNLYTLDWGPNDDISDNNARSRVPLLVFEELKRRNPSLHVPDSALPAGLLQVAGSEPLEAHPPVQEAKAAVTAPRPEHVHHHVHDPAGEAHSP